MEKFTASNGWELRSNGAIYSSDRAAYPLIGKDAVKALRGLFLHERDQELGRWRWPENPDYVVYRKAASASEPHPGVRVVHEATGRSRDIGVEVNNACDPTVSMFGRAARAYFAAHPEPKPWHDAKPGEVWVLTVDGYEDMVMTVHESKYGGYRFRLTDQDGTIYALDTPAITAGRRIWPEEKN